MMSDDKTKQGKRDDIRIDSKDPNELAYAARKLNVSVHEIKEALRIVGDLRSDVEDFFKQDLPPD
jgi:cell division protein ZapA (FtsZ GTPase activity inhibitor)